MIKNFKRHIIICIIHILFLMVSVSVTGRQIPISTIFVENPFAFNPAVAGTDNGFKARINSRMQWLGFGDGPFTNTLSGFGPHAIKNIGYGANLIIDRTGPISMLKANGGFASNFFITSDIRASLGLNLGIIQYRADGTQFDLPNRINGGADDPKAPATIMTSTVPDAGAGMYIYHHDYFIGFSAQQLFNSILKLSNEEAAVYTKTDENRLKPHFYMYGGYRLFLDNKLVVEPAILLRMTPSTPMQMDFCARVIYDHTFWGGISARNTFDSFDDLSLIFGYIHERRISVAIAYDFSFAAIRKYTAGTVELVLGYNFDDVRRGR